MSWPPAPPPIGRPALWPIFVMLVITLVAVGAAVAAWLRPIPQVTAPAPPKPTYSAQQVADAKSKVCAAYGKIHSAVDMNVGRSNSGDASAKLLSKVNMRQIFIAGSAHLFTTLADEPATPPALASEAWKLAHLLQELVLYGLASDPAVPTNDAVNATGLRIEGLCK